MLDWLLKILAEPEKTKEEQEEEDLLLYDDYEFSDYDEDGY